MGGLIIQILIIQNNEETKNVLPKTLASNPPCLLLLPNLAPTSGSSSTAGSSSPKLIWGLGLAFCKSLNECYGHFVNVNFKWIQSIARAK